MAHTVNTTEFTPVAGGIFQRIGNWFALVGEAAYVARGMEARAEKLRDLQCKSDAELKQMGLTRDELPAYVFRDLMFA